MTMPVDVSRKAGARSTVVTCEDAEELSLVHARCFECGWTPRAFADLLAASDVKAFVAPGPASGSLDLIVVRHAGGEAEILILGVCEDVRRRGIAAALLDHAVRWLAANGIGSVFLEVAEDNLAARDLYAQAGFVEVGRRGAYYRKPHGCPSAALVLRLPIGGA